MTDEDRVKQLLHDRSILELWLDKHNHFMAMLRTVCSLFGAIISIIVLYKVW